MSLTQNRDRAAYLVRLIKSKAIDVLTIKTNPEVAEEFHKFYYHKKLWDNTTFLGVKVLKYTGDLWNYQEIISELRPQLVVEFGTRFGGSALYFSHIMKMISPTGKVLSVDITMENADKKLWDMDNLELIENSSASQEVAKIIAQRREQHPGPVFFLLDSDHSRAHVLAELENIRSVTRPGDYVIVEDSNVNGHPVFPAHGPGPYEAMEDYFSKYPNDYKRDEARETKFGFTFAPAGFLIRQ